MILAEYETLPLLKYISFIFPALLAAACPESAPFMADECLMAIPDIEGIDYTTKEYLKFANHINSVAERLNKAAAESKRAEAVVWSPHKVELALWTHYVVNEHKPELLSSKYYQDVHYNKLYHKFSSEFNWQCLYNFNVF